MSSSPAIAGFGMAVFTTDISAEVLTWVIIVELLLSGIGFGVVELITAVLLKAWSADEFTIPLINIVSW